MTTPPPPPPRRLALVEVRIDEDDLTQLSETRACFDRLLALRPGRVEVDLSGCRWLDLAALHLLRDVHRRLTGARAVLAVRAADPDVRRALRAAGLEPSLPVPAGQEGRVG
ncbi:STAS domain-containing protein [Micromonospora siamensis]|uniref:Anti-anti-sigma regulatory factor (Antagonist of anti-sigma factor) n=1 Tax=Micromonospora siamensis TaxID=299152 RepID=A0A1C5INL4_9ACTN|nr:STAS domain-containing protein [Micromonospora siamensis]SCG59733.1 Anti-anti-sigma regulatory factor (antagonist of anti-sigma factor) [Micromonospora siamensis]